MRQPVPKANLRMPEDTGLVIPRWNEKADEIISREGWPGILRLAKERSSAFFAQNRIDPRFFYSVYSERTVRHDLARAEKKKAEFAREGSEKTEKKIIADALEAMSTQYGIDWIDRDARFFIPSSYDDIFRGSDIVLAEGSAKERPRRIASLDVTFDEQRDRIARKIFFQLRKIFEGELTTLAYFSMTQEDKSAFHGHVSMVPHFIIGIGEKETTKLVKAWITGARLEYESIRYAFAREIQAQIQAYATFARRFAPAINRERIASKIERSINVDERRLGSLDSFPELAQDPVMCEIERICQAIHDDPADFIEEARHALQA